MGYVYIGIMIVLSIAGIIVQCKNYEEGRKEKNARDMESYDRMV